MATEWMVLAKDDEPLRDGDRQGWYQVYKDNGEVVAWTIYWDIVDAYGEDNALLLKVCQNVAPRVEEDQS